jgi:hypothetical protein
VIDEATIGLICGAIIGVSTLANNVMNWHLSRKSDRNHASLTHLHECLDDVRTALQGKQEDPDGH